jgi:hypothetical protein
MLSMKIWSGTARGRRYQPPSVGRSVKARELPGTFACRGAGFGMISKRHLFKDTFGFEMSLML